MEHDPIVNGYVRNRECEGHGKTSGQPAIGVGMDSVRSRRSAGESPRSIARPEHISKPSSQTFEIRGEYENYRNLPHILLGSGTQPRIRFRRGALMNWIASHELLEEMTAFAPAFVARNLSG